jgi:hypothetical protein
MDKAVELNLSDFPEYLGDIVKSYFDKTYPGDHVVVRYHPVRPSQRSPAPVRSASNPGEIAYMPHELVTQIMRGNRKTARKGELINKNLSGTSKDFDYSNLCSKPITAGEVVRELSSGAVILSKIGYVKLSGGIERIFELYKHGTDLAMVWTHPKIVSRSASEVTISSRTLIAERINGTTFSFFNLSREDSPLLHLDINKSLSDNGIEIDILTLYRITKGRTICMKNSPSYLDDTILETYSELARIEKLDFKKRPEEEGSSSEGSSTEEGSSSEEKLRVYQFSLKTAQNTLFYNYMDWKISKTELIKGSYDVNRSGVQTKLLKLNHMARVNIRRELIGLVPNAGWKQ